ncbi:DUF6056 family protein [Francisella sp. 19X1-34]|uniref:DUF6056 family protein n=1 Tax=Francisella sp. 19X1-34 TaxID=3087177 RepID=UPI002E318695|nr:DUF6056 family protein [Francisella sp. 19X1-34]MED7789597.1 DUF6056 family protein [Francisella sp. 19X1-34]
MIISFVRFNRVSLLILCVIFLCFLFANVCQPMFMDDFWRSNIDAFYNGTIFANLKHDYFCWTGRLSAQLPVYFFFNKDYPSLIYLLDIINALAMTSLIIFLFKSITKGQDKIPGKEFIVYLGIFMSYFMISGFIAHSMWKTVGIQYLWGLTLLIIFYYYCFVEQKEIKILSFIIGVIIGLYNVAFSMVIFILFLCYIVHQLLQKQKINKNTFFFFIPFVISTVILITAPGNYVRESNMINGQSLFLYLITHIVSFIGIFFSSWELSLPFILSIILTSIYEENIKTKVLTLVALILVSCSMLLIMFGLALRVEMIYMTVYFYIACKYLFNSNIYDVLKRVYILFSIIVLIFFGLLLSSYLQVGLYNGTVEI